MGTSERKFDKNYSSLYFPLPSQIFLNMMTGLKMKLELEVELELEQELRLRLRLRLRRDLRPYKVR